MQTSTAERKWAYACFEDVNSRVHITTDCWTSPNNHTFMGVGAHFHRDVKLISFILDFVTLEKVHTWQPGDRTADL